MQDKAAIRLYSKARIDEIIYILQNPSKTTTNIIIIVLSFIYQILNQFK